MWGASFFKKTQYFKELNINERPEGLENLSFVSCSLEIRNTFVNHFDDFCQKLVPQNLKIYPMYSPILF